jgi:hypothetical protein
MPGSSTTPGRPSACAGALGHIAFHYTDSVGTRNQFSIAAQWLACTFPCRRFADILTDACGSGPMWFAIPSSQWTCSLPVSRRTCVKTKSDLVVMPSGRQIFAFFCSPHHCRAQNSGCDYTPQSFYTARVKRVGPAVSACPASPPTPDIWLRRR